MGVDFGTDVAWDPATGDVDAMLSTVSGIDALAQSLLRRFSTPRGSLPWAPNAGFDLRGCLNRSYTPAQLLALKLALADEARKDERVQDAAVDLVFSAGELEATFTITAAAGPFTLVLAAGPAVVTMRKLAQAGG